MLVADSLSIPRRECWPLAGHGTEWSRIEGGFRRIPLGVRKAGPVGSTGKSFLIEDAAPASGPRTQHGTLAIRINEALHSVSTQIELGFAAKRPQSSNRLRLAPMPVPDLRRAMGGLRGSA